MPLAHAMSGWIDNGSGGGYDKSETAEQRTLRIYGQIIERHTPLHQDDPCPICLVVDCDERRLAQLRVRFPSEPIPPNNLRG